MGSCLGGFAKFPCGKTSKRVSRKHSKRRGVSGIFLLKKEWWSTSAEEMDNHTDNSHSMQRNASVGSTSQAKEGDTAADNANNNSFVNNALILWNERRREWVGNRSQSRMHMPREPTIRNSNLIGVSDADHQDNLDNGWNATYDDLLATNQPFPQPVPLPEMIDFLVDVWHEEGLYE